MATWPNLTSSSSVDKRHKLKDIYILCAIYYAGIQWRNLSLDLLR